jgi:hypothetical protein
MHWCITWMAVPMLKAAQRKFTTARLRDCPYLLHYIRDPDHPTALPTSIELRSPNVRLLPNNERPWCRTDVQQQMWKEYAVVTGSPRKRPSRLRDGGHSDTEDVFSSRTSPASQDYDPHNNDEVSSISSGQSVVRAKHKCSLFSSDESDLESRPQHIPRHGTSDIWEDDSIAAMIMDMLDTPPKTNPKSSPGNSASTNSTTPCPILCLGCQWVSQGDHSRGPGSMREV